MSREIARTLREAARQRRSFIVFAVPRLAGKSTVLHAVLAERPASAPLRTLGESGDTLDEILRESDAGYFVIPEITQSAAMPGYVWGAPVRRILKEVGAGVALAVTLHADGTEEAFAQICDGCKVPDADASKIGLAVHLRSLGRWEEPTRRVVAAVDLISGVRDGRPRTRRLFHWDEATDRFL